MLNSILILKELDCHLYFFSQISYRFMVKCWTVSLMVNLSPAGRYGGEEARAACLARLTSLVPVRGITKTHTSRITHLRGGRPRWPGKRAAVSVMEFICYIKNSPWRESTTESWAALPAHAMIISHPLVVFFKWQIKQNIPPRLLQILKRGH